MARYPLEDWVVLTAIVLVVGAMMFTLSGCGGLSYVRLENSPGAVVVHEEARSLAGPATAAVVVKPEEVSMKDVAGAVVELRQAGGAK